MAKQYTRAEWARIQSALPEEDRVPYSLSPNKFDTPADVRERVDRFAQVIEPGVAVEDFPASITQPRTGAPVVPMDITSERYTAGAIAAGLTPTPVGATGPINIPVFESGVTEPTLVNGTTIVTAPTLVTQTTQTGPTQTFTAPDGRIFTDINAYNAYIAQLEADNKRKMGQSAFDFLKMQFAEYGLEALVADVEKYIRDGLSKEEFLLRLRTESDAYKKRFAANEQRIKKGLRALSEGEYIELEDEYQDRMRRYGLPPEYYARGEMGIQQGFEKFIANDVSPIELEDRIQTAQRRVLNAAPQIKNALSQYYGAEIGNGDILAYVLDPEKAIEGIKRKVTAAEIGGAAAIAGLGATRARAEELGAFGVTAEQAREGFQSIAGMLPRAGQLADIYKTGPYTQTIAEQEAFGLAGAAEAGRQRRRLTELEQAAFSGTSGMTGGALARDRAGAI